MPVFPGVLMCKLIHLRTQVRTVSVRICVYSYATSSSETDSCVQTGTSVDCVYMTEICRGTESCSRPQDCELQLTLRRIRKDTQRKSSSGYFYHSVIKTIVWKSFRVISEVKWSEVKWSEVAQSCPTLSDPRDSSPPGSPVPGILQARTLEWAAISFSNAWKWKVKVKSLRCVWLLVTPWTAAYQAPPPMGFSRQAYWSGVPLPSLERLSSSLLYDDSDRRGFTVYMNQLQNVEAYPSLGP